MKPLAWVWLLHLLGSAAALCALRGRHLAFSVCSGLVWGVALFGLLALAPLCLRYAAGAAPLYAPSLVALLVLLAAGVAVAVLLRRAPGWGCSWLRVLGAQALALALLGATTLAALRWNISPMTLDSFGYLERGLALSAVADPRYVTLEFLQATGVFAALLHAPTRWLGLEYLYFLTPVLSASFLATLAVATAQAVASLGRSARTAAMAAGLSLLCLASAYLVVFQVFYLHVNWLASMYVLLFFHCAWMGLREERSGWFALCAVAAVAFQLIRVEGALFVALFLVLLACEPRSERPLPRWTAAALAAPGVVWCLVVAAIVGPEGRIVGEVRLLLMAGALGLAGALAYWAQRPRLRRRAGALQWALLAVLAGAFVVELSLRSHHVSTSLGVLLGNAFVGGRWAASWALLLAFALAFPVLGRVPQQRFALFGIAGYVALLVLLGYFGAWRSFWYDSGNRMLTHILPTAVWAFALRAAAIAPRRESAGAASAASEGAA